MNTSFKRIINWGIFLKILRNVFFFSGLILINCDSPVSTPLFPYSEGGARIPEYSSPVWSPDGTKIAFTLKFDTTATSGIYIMDNNGANVILLDSSGEHPTWSPDSKKIACQSDNTIKIIRVDTKNKTTVFSYKNLYEGMDWSPDGSKLAIGLSGSVNKSDIYTINIDGSNLTNLTNDSHWDANPRWSPDGKKIVFESDKDNSGYFEIYTMDANGAHKTRLTNNQMWDHYPSWSPDGLQIVFVSRRSNTDELYKMDSNGANLIILTTNNYQEHYPSWSPDGEKIVFDAKDNMISGIYVLKLKDLTMTCLKYNHLF